MTRKLIVSLLLLFGSAAAALPASTAAPLPDENGTAPAVESPWFPGRQYAFVWRNWTLVPARKLADVLDTPVSPELLPPKDGEISQKTDMQFLYNDNELQGIQVNVSLKNATLHEMLDKIFAGLPLSYSILDSVIVISPKGKPLPQALKTVTITGQIKDKDGNPLPGATVRIKDTQMGVVSDQDGKFKLEVGEIKDLMLQVSFIGYKTQTVKPGEQRVLYIVLEEEAQKMDEVVVTGYFTKTKNFSVIIINIINIFKLLFLAPLVPVEFYASELTTIFYVSDIIVPSAAFAALAFVSPRGRGRTIAAAAAGLLAFFGLFSF